MNWKKFKEEKPSEGEEVLAYHPSWKDEDMDAELLVLDQLFDVE